MDNRLIVIGIGKRNVFAIGDCATIESPSIKTMFQAFFNAESGDGSIKYQQLKDFVQVVQREDTQLHLQMRYFMDLLEIILVAEYLEGRPLLDWWMKLRLL